MAIFLSGPYEIEIHLDPCYTEYSAEKISAYELVYLDQSEYRCNTIAGIKIRQNDCVIRTAVIGTSGGGTGIHETSLVIENDRLVVCCSESIFCLSIPDLKLLWKTKADMIACFEIFAYKDSYIVHGEMEISRLDKDGNILWQQGGGDIFTTLDGKDIFALTDKYIIARDWSDNEYMFDYDGNVINRR